MSFPEILQNAVWHTTSVERFLRICETGAILSEPELSNSERWKASQGPDLYPFVRMLGGVSLFEFQNFDPDVYATSNPMSSWQTFVPFVKNWGRSIWMEIDAASLGSCFVGAASLLDRWKRDNAHRHTIMPRIEAASLAPVPTSAFLRVLTVGADDPSWRDIQDLQCR